MRPMAHIARPATILSLSIAFLALALPAAASAQDLNSFRRANGRNALHMSTTLSAAAHSHASSMAARGHLDHDGFTQRIGRGGGAENVAYGCADQACAMRMWTRSGGHRANMLRKDVTAYGIASASGADGRRYWVLELGN